MSEEITNHQPPAISKEQVKKILKADLANMVKKVANGKTLSSTERALLTAMSEGAEIESEKAATFAKKQSELATILKLKDRKTIQRWLKEPGNPGKCDDGRYDVMLWRQYAKLKGHDLGDESGESSTSATSAKAKQTLLQNERLEMKILEERGDLMPKLIAQKVFSKLLLEAKARCFSATSRFVTLAKMAPTVEAANEEVRKEMVLIWKALEDGAWQK